VRKSLQVAFVTIILLLAVGLGVIAYGRPHGGADEGQRGLPDNRPPDNRPPDNRPPDNRPPVDCPSLPDWDKRRPSLRWVRRLLANASAIEINGTVVAVVKTMLVLDTDEGHLRVHLPALWTVASEVVDRDALFNTTFSSVGQDVTVRALQAELFETSEFGLTVSMGYELINADAVHAYAVLPFNIELND
jgi:hypothetical protein